MNETVKQLHRNGVDGIIEHSISNANELLMFTNDRGNLHIGRKEVFGSMLVSCAQLTAKMHYKTKSQNSIALILMLCENGHVHRTKNGTKIIQQKEERCREKNLGWTHLKSFLSKECTRMKEFTEEN